MIALALFILTVSTLIVGAAEFRNQHTRGRHTAGLRPATLRPTRYEGRRRA